MNDLEHNTRVFEGKNILVTGAAGFIGSNLTDFLVDRNANVFGFDNFFTGRIDNLSYALSHKNFKLIEGDIRNKKILYRKLKNIDIIFHLAAFTNPVKSVERPILCNDINITGSLNVLDFARNTNVEKFVFSSSAAVYGDLPELPKVENMPLSPISPYGITKMAGETYAKIYFDLYGLNTTILRYFNAYGPRQIFSPYSGVIPIFTSNISNGENLTIFGDGNQSRDFIYVKDIVTSNVQSYLSDASKGKILNISSAKTNSINELAELLLSLYGRKDLKILYKPERKGDILHSWGDNSLAKKILDFEPKYDIQKGLKEYIDYLKDLS